MFFAYIPTVTIRLMVLATVSLSPMLALEDASQAAPPATPEHDVVENDHGRQVQDPYRWLEQAEAPDPADHTPRRRAWCHFCVQSARGQHGRGA